MSFGILNKYKLYLFYEMVSYCSTFEININYIYLYEKISYCLILERIVENNRRIENIISRLIL
ncbi:hypothetical protein Hanom_Chr12g01139601 [Helianthus anomalus]